jgi:hypothetical protein
MEELNNFFNEEKLNETKEHLAKNDILVFKKDEFNNVLESRIGEEIGKKTKTQAETIESFLKEKGLQAPEGTRYTEKVQWAVDTLLNEKNDLSKKINDKINMTEEQNKILDTFKSQISERDKQIEELTNARYADQKNNLVGNALAKRRFNDSLPEIALNGAIDSVKSELMNRLKIEDGKVLILDDNGNVLFLDSKLSPLYDNGKGNKRNKIPSIGTNSESTIEEQYVAYIKSEVKNLGNMHEVKEKSDQFLKQTGRGEDVFKDKELSKIYMQILKDNRPAHIR